MEWSYPLRLIETVRLLDNVEYNTYLHSSMNFFKILVPLFKGLDSSLSFTELARNYR